MYTRPFSLNSACFIDYMVYNSIMIYRLIILLIIVSCGEYKYSPYAFDVPNINHNENTLNEILDAGINYQSLSPKPQFKIAVISDTHDYYDGLEKQVSFINSNANQIDFVIVAGDLTNVGLLSEYEASKSRLDRLKIPYLTTIGNHDLLIDGGTIYQRLFGDDTYAFNYKGTKFILYNNNNWESSSNIPDLNWVESELASNTQPNLILLSHVAPNDSDRFTESQISHTRDLVNDYGVQYYLNGHNHNPGEGTFGNATHLTIGSSSKNVVVVLTIDPEYGVEHEFINL